ncbi:MAG: cytochrome c1, partial [Methyloceanibacter sp.]
MTKLPLSLAFVAGVLLALLPRSGSAADEAHPRTAAQPPHAPKIAAQDWSFTGPLGTYDNAQLQR